MGPNSSPSVLAVEEDGRFGGVAVTTSWAVATNLAPRYDCGAIEGHPCFLSFMLVVQELYGGGRRELAFDHGPRRSAR